MSNPRPVRQAGGRYEIYVTSADGLYLAGGTKVYRNLREAKRTADSWLEVPGRRAYVVTCNKSDEQRLTTTENNNGT